MKVFWVLFLVLLNSIGNQGDPNHGLKTLETGPEELPLNIVSMRNNENCHICTGSIITTEWILSSVHCPNATHLLHGLREYENCTGMQVVSFRSIKQSYLIQDVCQLYKVEDMFNKTVEHLNIPPYNYHWLPQIGEVIGWSFDNSKRKFVMDKIDVISTSWDFSENDQAFLQELCVVGTGSPLIYNAYIYGILACSPNSFDNISSNVKLIHDAIKNYSSNGQHLKIDFVPIH